MKTIDLVNNNNLLNPQSYKIFEISEYISWTEIELWTEDDTYVRLNEGQNTYLHFIYNLKDMAELTSMGSNDTKHLTSFQSALLHEKEGLSTKIYLKNDNNFHIGIVQLTKFGKNGEVNDFFLQFEEVFKTMSAESYYMHTGLPNLELGEYVRKLMEMPKTEISDKIMAAGYIHILLSLKLKQFVEHKYKPNSESPLTQKELKIIKKVSDTILNQPHLNFNLDDLCSEIGLSANKLQQGIKDMHGKTVCEFIRHIRLSKAEDLLKNSDLNISEVVYELGWTSRSYFSKIFKERFNCTPSFYQKYYSSGRVAVKSDELDVLAISL